MSLRWPVVVYLSCDHFKMYPADDAPEFSQMVRCEYGCGPVAVVEVSTSMPPRCVHGIRLDKPCYVCDDKNEATGGFRLVEGEMGVEKPPHRPQELAKVVDGSVLLSRYEVGLAIDAVAMQIQDQAPNEFRPLLLRLQEAYSQETMLEVAPGVARTPLTANEGDQGLLLRLAYLAPPDAAEGVHGDTIGGGMGPAKVALVMKDAMALGLVELTSPKGDPYLYRLTEKGAEEVAAIQAARWSSE